MDDMNWPLRSRQRKAALLGLVIRLGLGRINQFVGQEMVSFGGW